MPWILYDVLAAATYNVIDPSKAIVSCDLLKLNESRVICASPNPVNVDREVKVIDQVVDPVTKAVTEEHTLIHGYVQKYAQITKGVTNNTYEYTIKELASELDKFRVHAATSYVVNCDEQNTSLYAATIFVDSGWSAATSVTNYIVKALQFRFMTSIAALNKVVSELSAASAATPLYMWFDSGSKTAGWGEYRTDRTAGKNFTKGTYYNYKEEKTVRNQVAGVVIYGANSAYDGHYPDPLPGGQHDLSVYQYDTATSDAECADIAKAVYLTWCADPKRRIQFVLRPADTKVSGQYILEGDRIQVDGLNYTVIDMTYSPKEVLIGLNAGEDSVLYSLGDKLRPVAGTATGASEVSWAPGTENVSSDNVTWTKFQIKISDVADINDPTVMMNVEIGPYKIYSYQGATTVSNQVLSDITLPSYSGVDSTGGYLVAGGATLYLPMVAGSAYLKSSLVVGGFQFAVASITAVGYNSYSNNWGGHIYCTCNYSWDAVNWYEGSYQSRFPIIHNTAATPADNPIMIFVTNTYLLPGTVNTGYVYVRWAMYNGSQPSDTGIIFYETSAAIDVLPRHTHVWQQTGQADDTMKSDQTDDLQESDVTPPSSVTCRINGGTPFTVNNNTPINIKTYLVSDVNDVEFRSGTVCTVTPTAVFQMFGA